MGQIKGREKLNAHENIYRGAGDGRADILVCRVVCGGAEMTMDEPLQDDEVRDYQQDCERAERERAERASEGDE